MPDTLHSDATPPSTVLDEPRENGDRLSHFRPLRLRKAADVIEDIRVDAGFREIADLNELLEPLVSAPSEFMHLDFQIHLRIAEAAQNPPLVGFLDELLKKQAAIRFEYLVETFSPAYAIDLHRRMLDAL